MTPNVPGSTCVPTSAQAAPVLEQLFSEHQMFHDGYQLERVIAGGAAVTPWATYKQALRELRTRFDALKLDYLKIENTRIDLDEVTFHLKGQVKVFDRRRMQNTQRSKQMELETLETTARDRAREFSYFFDLAAALRQDLPEDLTPEVRAKLDLDAWLTRLRLAAASDIISNNGKLSQKTMEGIRTLPPAERADVIAEVQDENRRKALVDWCAAFEPELPKVRCGLGELDVRELIELDHDED